MQTYCWNLTTGSTPLLYTVVLLLDISTPPLDPTEFHIKGFKIWTSLNINILEHALSSHKTMVKANIPGSLCSNWSLGMVNCWKCPLRRPYLKLEQSTRCQFISKTRGYRQKSWWFRVINSAVDLDSMMSSTCSQHLTMNVWYQMGNAIPGRCCKKIQNANAMQKYKKNHHPSNNEFSQFSNL